MARAWTEAYILSRIRATLRKLSMQMPAVRACKLACRRPYNGPNKQQKWEYKCAHCCNWFAEKETQVDHVVPAGSLKSFDDVGPFAQRLLFPAPGELQVLCRADHQVKTNNERAAAKAKKKALVTYTIV